MEAVYLKEIGNISGIDLADYVPDKNSYNPIVYIHKRYLSKDRKDVSKTCHKIQQYDCNIVNDHKTKTGNIKEDPLVKQTIQFAKDIVPITIPPSGKTFSNPVYYTVKASKMTKRKHDCNHKQKFHSDLEKEKTKHETEVPLVEKNKKSKLSHSIEESIPFSQNDTIDDLCCSLSETSEQKHFKGKTQRTKIKENCKVIPSESFEAIATQYTKSCADSNIKIHLMNDKDKNALCHNISSPIIKTIKDLFSELHNQSEVSQDMSDVHKAIVTNSTKLDRILDRLTRIERKLDKFGKEQSETPKYSKMSKLEEISKDIENIKENFSSEEELANVDLIMRKPKTNSVTSILENNRESNEISDEFAKGENIPERNKKKCLKAPTSPIGIKPERANRIPAKFCWTDSIKKN